MVDKISRGSYEVLTELFDVVCSYEPVPKRYDRCRHWTTIKLVIARQMGVGQVLEINEIKISIIAIKSNRILFYKSLFSFPQTQFYKC